MFDEKKVVNQESKFANGGSREIMTTVPLLLFFILGVFGVSRGGGYRSVGGMNTSYSCDGELLDLTCPENLVIKVKIPPPTQKRHWIKVCNITGTNLCPHSSSTLL